MQRLVADVDSELAYFLKVEALLKPRNDALLAQLVGKAKRFLERYDCTDMTHERRYELIIGAVKIAMLIDNLEDSVRQTLKNPAQDELRAKNAKFVKQGIVGHSGHSLLGTFRTSKLAD